MWKKLFWICLFLLLITNVYWVYQIFDRAVSKTYLEQSHDELEQDVRLLRSLIELNYNLKSLTQALDSVNYHYEIINDQEGIAIVFGSFEVHFNSDSIIERTRNFYESE